MAGLQETFEKLLGKISDAAVDFTELEVMTFTGNVNGLVNTTGKIDWSALLQKAATSTTTDGSTLHLVAATKLQLDGDSFHYRTNAKPEQIARLDELLKLHDESVRNSAEARQALITFMSDSLIKLTNSPTNK